MTIFTSQAELEAFIRQAIDRSNLAVRVTQLQRGPVKPRSYLAADIPSAAEHEGEIIYVSDGGAGAEFRASNGTAWVNLG